MIVAPEGGGNVHIDTLSHLSTMLMDEDFKNTLLTAKTPDEFIQIIDEKGNELDGAKKQKALEQPKDGYRVLDRLQSDHCQRTGHPNLRKNLGN